MASLRAGTVRDVRRKIYDKILRLPLSYFSEARKGDLMTRMSNDVQEIEISVMSSLSMLFRDPFTIIIFVTYLIINSPQLTLFACSSSSTQRMADRKDKPYAEEPDPLKDSRPWEGFFPFLRRRCQDYA